MLWLLVLTPVAGAALVLGLGRRGALPATAGLAVAVVAFTAALAIAAATGAFTPLRWATFGPTLAPGIGAEQLGRVMVVLVPLIALPVVLYAAYGRDRGPAWPRLLALLVVFVGAMELLVLASDFLTLLVAWELVGACSWALIGHQWRDALRPRAALGAFLTTRAGDLGLYVAAAALFTSTGSLGFFALEQAHGSALQLIAAGALVASAAKSAQLPFSPWLFAAMAGPTAASALLHSATMVAAGAYLLARLAQPLSAVSWFGPTVAVLGLATALAGGVVATLQDDFKKVLAASTSAQYGLMLVAIGAGYPGAAGIHLVTHAVFKALLFLCAGVALHAASTLELSRLRLGETLPRVALLSAIGALALAGVPPLGAAFSKEAIVAAAAHAARWLAWGVLLAGFLSALYAARLQWLAFGPGTPRVAQRPTTGEGTSLVLLAALCLVLGALGWPSVGDAFATYAGASLPPGAAWQVVASLATIVAAVLLSAHLGRRDLLSDLGLRPATRAAAADWLGLPRLAHVVVVLPVRASSRALALFDDRVVDAGLRLTQRTAQFASRTLARVAEGLVDALIGATAEVTQRLGRLSWRIDDRGVDRAVERLAEALGMLGEHSRRLQTGLAHDYYRLAAAGLGLMVIVAAAVVWV